MEVLMPTTTTKSATRRTASKGASKPKTKTRAPKAGPTAATTTRKATPPFQAGIERALLISVGAAATAGDAARKVQMPSFKEDIQEDLSELRQRAGKKLRVLERRGGSERNRAQRQFKTGRIRLERELRNQRRGATAAIR